jgi:hypothetical protein
VNDQKSREQEPSVTSEPSLVPRQAAQDRLEATRESQAQSGDLRNKMKSNSQDREMKDGFAVEPRRPLRLSRVATRMVGWNVVMLPCQLRLCLNNCKKSLCPLRRLVVRIRSSRQRPMNRPRMPKAQPIQPAAPAGARSAPGALSARRMEQDKPANVEEARAADVAA